LVAHCHLLRLTSARISELSWLFPASQFSDSAENKITKKIKIILYEKKTKQKQQQQQ